MGAKDTIKEALEGDSTEVAGLDIFATYATDAVKEVEGVWFPIGKGCELLVARAKNKRFKEKAKEVFKPHRVAIQNDTMEDGLAEQLLCDVLAETVLLGWKNLKSQGKLLTYSKETAKKLLIELEPFRDLVAGLADNLDMFKVEADAKAGKNS